jgi:hypothetical protein
MATLTYVGGETAGPTAGTHWDGVQFPLNVPVDVSSEELVAKAKGHPHFKVEDEEQPKERKAKAAEPAPDEAPAS